MQLPRTEFIRLASDRAKRTLYITFDRPRVRNAMNVAMLGEIEAVIDAARLDRDLRTIVLRGAGGYFCAGADLRELSEARAAGSALGAPLDSDPIKEANKCFGRVIMKVDRAPQAVIAVLEGVVLGGGLGLACASDVALCHARTQFALPEVTRGLPPAQIAPFLVRRLGASQARRLAVTAARFDGRRAAEIGLVHEVCADTETLERAVEVVLKDIDECAPSAIATTKTVLRQVGAREDDALLDDAAELFSQAVRSPDGIEGMRAFVEKRRPRWASQTVDSD